MLALALLVTGTCQAAPQVDPAPQLQRHDFSAWREHIAPSAAESRWRAIPWRATMGSGLRDAARDAKPMLLWLMNGHPLGCT